jgi:hypothetical protein
MKTPKLIELDIEIQRKFNVDLFDIPPFVGMVKTRLDLYLIMAEAGFITGAEIGVGRGKNAGQICKLVSGVKLFCIDPWEPYWRRRKKEHQEESFQAATKFLKNYDAEIIRKRSLDAVADFEDSSLDFIYIDGNHEFDHIMSELIAWTPKVKIGGIVSGHDYAPRYRFGVMEAVNAYTRAHNIGFWYLTDERWATFFWVRKHNI